MELGKIVKRIRVKSGVHVESVTKSRKKCIEIREQSAEVTKRIRLFKIVKASHRHFCIIGDNAGYKSLYKILSTVHSYRSR